MSDICIYKCDSINNLEDDIKCNISLPNFSKFLTRNFQPYRGDIYVFTKDEINDVYVTVKNAILTSYSGLADKCLVTDEDYDNYYKWIVALFFGLQRLLKIWDDESIYYTHYV